MRNERILGMVILLLNKEYVSIKALTEYFNISREDILKDLELIKKSGIPIINSSIEDTISCSIDSTFFENNKIHLIPSIIKTLEKSFDKREENTDTNITFNILNNWDYEKDSYCIDIDPHKDNNILHKELSLIKKAILNKNLLEFVYINNLGIEEIKKIAPYKLLLKNGFWYIEGFCLNHENFTRFQLRKIKKICILKEQFPDKLNTNDNLEEQNKIHLELHFEKDIAYIIEDYFCHELISKIDSNHYKVEGLCIEDEKLYSFLLGLGTSATIIEPKHLNKVLYEKAYKLIEKLKDLI